MAVPVALSVADGVTVDVIVVVSDDVADALGVADELALAIVVDVEPN